MSTALTSFPASDVTLRTGTTVHVQPVTPADAERLAAFYTALSPEARFFRFFSGGVDVAAFARHFATSEWERGLIAVTGDGEVVAHGDFIPEGEGSAEVAFAVADAWQGHGIATILLGQLAQAAQAEGVERFRAVVLPANHRMIDTFRSSGFAVGVHAGAEGLTVTFPTALDAEGRARAADRERRATVAAVGHVLRPASVVLVGASATPGSIGAALAANLEAFGGPVWHVNARTGPLRSVRDVPGTPELAVIAVPAPAVAAVARDCAAQGVQALVVISDGFADDGPAGRARQDELLAICRGAGMRMVGPNCLGVVDTGAGLDATFAVGAKTAGSIAFASQSGAFGITAADGLARRGAGLSAFVSLGNKADLSGNDMLQAWEADPRTRVIAPYLESFGNPRRFGEIARRVTRAKPVLAVKAGRSGAGRRAAASHTAALVAASDANVDALFRHAGVIRVDTVDELFDTAALLAGQPLPAGNRVAIVTNAGGPGILGADACSAAGLDVAGLEAGTREALRRAVPAAASVTNPVDVVAAATDAELAAAVGILAAAPEVDAIIAAFVSIDGRDRVPPVLLDPPAGKPVVPVLLGADPPRPSRILGGVEEAARALSHVAAYARHRSAPEDPVPDLGADTDRADAVIATALGRGDEWLAPAEVDALLAAWGLPRVPARTVATPTAVRRAAAELGGHVALKAIAPGLVHKTERGAVRLGLSPAGAARAARELREQIDGVTGFLVQAMAPAGPELLIGIATDPQFGPLVVAGAGGIAAEVLGDVQLRLAPVGRREAGDMLHGLRTFGLLNGFRGRPAADVAAVEDAIVRLSALAAAHPAVVELDCNPLIAAPSGALIVDARVRVRAPAPPPPYGALA